MSVQYRAIRGTNALIDEDQYKAVAEKWRSGSFSDWSFDLKFGSKAATDLLEVNAGAGDAATGNQYGGIVQPDYASGLIPPAQRPLIVAQLFHQETTSSNLVRIVKTTDETAASDSGSTEGVSYDAYEGPPSPHDYKVVDTAATLPTSEDFLMDVPSAMPYLAKRLAYLVGRAEEKKMVYGDGSAPNMLGLVNAEDSDEAAQAMEQGSETLDDAVALLMTKVFSASGLLPTWVLMNPLRWLDYSTAKSTDGQYLTGHASRDQAFQLWGMRVAMSNSISQDTIVVGSPEAAGRWVHTSGVHVEASHGYSTYFGEGRVLVKAKIRSTIAYEYPSGIGVLTMGS